MPSYANDASVVEVTDALVRALVDEQFPQLADREVGRHYRTEDHVSVRIGDDYGVRLPTVPGFDHLYERSCGLIAPHRERWTFPWSGPIAVGQPTAAYPYHWEVVPWLTASTSGFVPLRPVTASALGDALRQVHVPAPDDAPLNPRSATELRDLNEEFDYLLAFIGKSEAPEGHVLHPEAVARDWQAAITAPGPEQAMWTHGNLEPRAVLSDQGHFAGILLWHYFGAGDPAADVGQARILLPHVTQDTLLSSYGDISAAMRARAQGFMLINCLRFIASGHPFLGRLAWERLIEQGFVEE